MKQYRLATVFGMIIFLGLTGSLMLVADPAGSPLRDDLPKLTSLAGYVNYQYFLYQTWSVEDDINTLEGEINNFRDNRDNRVPDPLSAIHESPNEFIAKALFVGAAVQESAFPLINYLYFQSFKDLQHKQPWNSKGDCSTAENSSSEKCACSQLMGGVADDYLGFFNLIETGVFKIATYLRETQQSLDNVLEQLKKNREELENDQKKLSGIENNLLCTLPLNIGFDPCGIQALQSEIAALMQSISQEQQEANQFQPVVDKWGSSLDHLAVVVSEYSGILRVWDYRHDELTTLCMMDPSEPGTFASFTTGFQDVLRTGAATAAQLLASIGFTAFLPGAALKVASLAGNAGTAVNGNLDKLNNELQRLSSYKILEHPCPPTAFFSEEEFLCNARTVSERACNPQDVNDPTCYQKAEKALCSSLLCKIALKISKTTLVNFKENEARPIPGTKPLYTWEAMRSYIYNMIGIQ